VPVPGPTALGRGVVVLAGEEPPASWAGATRVVVDEGVLAAPEATVERLHAAWAGREPVVVVLAVDPAAFRAPRAHDVEPWRLGAGFSPWFDRLHFLVWANAYDARTGEPIWWWGRKAERVGAATAGADGPGDVVLPDGTPAWIDGGPRSPLEVPLAGAAVVHSESVELGSLDALPAPVAPAAELAPDQLAAVAHGAGPARISAPAGSGKTRVLTERLRHLLGGRSYPPQLTLAVAYNKQAQLEMAGRTAELGARIQTLNAWGYELVGRWLGSRPQVLDEREVRSIVERLVPRQQRRVNTDPLGPYLDGLSLIRLGMRDPDEVEALLGEVPGLAAAYDPYRAELRRRGVIDFDEQVYLAVEALLADGEFRREAQARHRHLLVDEFQDLTPAHVLLVRLLACPTYDVFAVGDDDQTIYGHAGADPGFLVDFGDYFPGASSYALEVNHRCPAPVTGAAATLLGYNRRRVDKVIRPGDGVSRDPAALEVRGHAPDAGAAALVEAVTGWLRDGDAAPTDLAVLTRVHSLLLAPHVALTEAGVPLRSVLDENVLKRLGVRAALAYLRIATDPGAVSPADLLEVHRRPSRGLPRWAEKFLGRCHSVVDVRKAATRIDDRRVAQKLDDLAADLDRLARMASRGADARALLTAVRDDIGLGSAMTLLDSTGAASASHLDDLEALLQVADLHPDAATFEGWLRQAFHRERDESGVTLSTVHRVKGREWLRVAVFGVTDGIVPHRLSTDVEEERRVLHVAITRGRERVLVLGDVSRRSRFLDELAGTAPVAGPAPAPADLVPTPRRAPEAAAAPVAAADETVIAALKAWRTERARAERFPPYVVLNDKHLEGIAARMPATLEELRACPGIGPAKLESYGDDILEVLQAVTGEASDR
jgi:DNA helicase II / ATP-dependent DNA helicase PcrA